MIKLVDVLKSYKGKTILNNISAEFLDEEISVIVGANGSGKTTLCEIISGLRMPDSGRVYINEIENCSDEFKVDFFYMPADFYLPEYMTGNEYAEFVLSRYPQSDKVYFEQILHLLDMKDHIEKVIESYSFGMKKKLQILIALSTNANTVLADEIFSGLDFETTAIVHELVSVSSSTTKFVIVAHELDTLQKFSNDVWVLRTGKMVRHVGNPMDLIDEICCEGEIKKRVQNIARDKSR